MMGLRLVVRSTWSTEKAESYVYEFSQSRIVIGRHKGADVHIPHPAVSGHHASIRSEGARVVIVDEGSTNGTRVGGERIPEGRPKPLGPNDWIDLGGFRITVEIQPVLKGTSHAKTAALAREIVRGALTPSKRASPPRLLVLNGPTEGAEVPLPAPPAGFVLGRGDEADLTLSDEDLSREHAELGVDLDGALLKDLGSKNGTFVNERPIDSRRLHDGDEIRLGKTILLFEDVTERELREICEAPEKQLDVPEPPAPAAEPDPDEDETSDATVGSGTPGTSSGTAASARTSENGAGASSTSGSSGISRKSEQPPAARAAGSGLGADIIIYLLAGAVLALSIAGLVMLLRGG